jgi:(1->4)-alpha-D-glucan 1-alpha-D-glucosylmutase
MYVVVEKILGDREALPATWPVDGTTGYDYANQVDALFVDAHNQTALTDLYAAFTHRNVPFGDLVNSTKKMIMLTSLPSEVNELAFQLKRMANQSRWYRDLTLNSLTFALREVMASLPIYRTYLTEASRTIDQHDRAAIEAAVADARRRNPRTAAAVFDFLRAVLLQEYPEDATEETQAEWTGFVMRFQQLTSPVVAKGIEDTAFYIYNRLLSLNEVGGNPEKFGLSPTNFHRLNQQRRARWPHSMLASSTHDSKRSSDVRARIDVLSETPRTFRQAVMQWGRLNRSKKTVVHGTPAPDRNDEYLLYQTLLGAWPLGEPSADTMSEFHDRIQAYMEKAIKEAKIHTSWVNPNAEYDEAVKRFVDAILTGPRSSAFLASFQPMRRLVAFYGMLNSLAKALLQLTAPGVPDIYQGSELWDFSLVDPDNRRPVDFNLRERYLAELRAGLEGEGERAPEVGARAMAEGARVEPHRPARDSGGEGGPGPLAVDLLSRWEDGRVKLYVIQQALAARREHPWVFGEGAYRPLETGGSARDHAVAFARQAEDRAFVTVVPRLSATLTREQMILPLGREVWGETAVELPTDLAAAPWRNRLTGETIRPVESEGKMTLPLAAVFRSFPGALLEQIQ